VVTTQVRQQQQPALVAAACARSAPQPSGLHTKLPRLAAKRRRARRGVVQRRLHLSLLPKRSAWQVRNRQLICQAACQALVCQSPRMDLFAKGFDKQALDIRPGK
jgi:hypothetical protein